jgi:hypothetical protein
MPEVPLDPSVAQLSPNFYSAAIKSTLDPKSRLMVEQLSQSHKKGKELLKLSDKKAREEFLKLDPMVQNNIRYIYAGKEQFLPEQGLLGKVVQGVGKAAMGTAMGVASPFIAAFKAAEEYGQLLNTGYVAKAQLDQGKPFTKKLLSDSYNGLNSWRWDKVAKFEKQYGKALITLARGNAEGRTIGESIDEYGPVDDDMYAAIRFMGDEPTKFQNLLSTLKLETQVSPGRDFANKMPTANTTVDKNHWAVKFTKMIGIDVSTKKGTEKAKKLVSGPVDAIYQVVIDPLTYVGVGPAAKAFTKGVDGIQVGAQEALRFVGLKSRGQKMADQYQFISEKAGTAAAGMDWAFRQPEVINFWDEPERGLGPLMKRYTEAESPTVKSQVWNQIKADYPQYRNRELVKLISTEMKKTNDWNAVGAKRFFTQVDDFDTMLSGPVDGVSFRRDGIPTARFYRNMTSAVHRTAYDLFNPTISAKATDEAIRKNDEGLETIMNTLRTVSNDSEVLLNPNIEDIFALQSNVKSARKIAYQIGTGLSRSPGRILWGDNSIKTVESVRNLANQVMDTKFADAFAEAYPDESAEVQITMIRNLYNAFMIKIGMYGSPGGKAQAEEILAKTFNETGMLSTTRSEVPLEWVDEISPNLIRYENDIPFQASKGIIEPSQMTDGISPLPYDLLYQYAASSKLSEKTNFTNLLGGATRNNFVRKYTDFWADLTLYPRLGIRSAIDETFFFFMYAPYYDVKAFLKGEAIFPTRALTSITGSKAAQGQYARGLYKVMKNLDPTKKFSPEVRYNAIKKLAEMESVKRGYNVPQAEISMALIREDMVYRAQDLYKNTVPESVWKNIEKLMRNNPVVFESMINSMGARSSISGKIDVDFVDSMFTPSNLSKMMTDAGLVKSGKYTARQVSEMSESAIAVTHFDNWSIRFPYNSEPITAGIKLSPAPVFYKHNALKTKDDFIAARNELMESMGVAYDDAIEGFAVTNPELSKRFLSKFSSTVYYRQQGVPDEEIARIHVENMLLDMRNTFHGGPNTYNEELFGLVKSKYAEIEIFRMKSKQSMDNAWENASAGITFDEFQKATVGRHPVSGEINTRLVSHGDNKDMSVFEEEGGLPKILEKFQNWSMEVMDATVTGMYRQKALWIYFDERLNSLAPYEKMLSTRMETELIEQGMSPALAKARAAAHAEKQTVEIAFKDSSEKLLEYVDNPEVKSNFAVSVRSVGRFYRATEDFHRRMFRLFTKAPLRTLYRLRLLNTGLDAAGDVYEDDKGDKYVVFPTDTIINSAIEPVIRTLTGNKTFNIPTFNDITLKLRLINPSFAPDAGQPAFAGPIGAVTVLSIRALLRNIVPFAERIIPGNQEGIVAELQPKFEKAADVVGQIGLGNFADSMTFRKALTPMLADTSLGALSTLTPYEWDRQSTTATLQAMAYFQANGLGISEDATAEEKKKYIDNLKISASNIIIARTILGYISPGMPTFKESKDLPAYMRKVGITSFKAEFWDIYNGILRNAGDDVSDVFDLAVATFVGKNPGKVIWTVPRTEKEYKVFIAQTTEVKNWAIENKAFVDTYKEVAYLFAPRAGDYNSDVYNWLQAEGLIKLPEFEDYLLRLQIAEDKEQYFEIGNQLEKRLETVGITQERKELINIAAQSKKDLITSNPYLEAAINGSINERGELGKKFKALNEAINSNKTPVDKQTRKAMKIILEEVASFVVLANDESMGRRYDFTQIKEQRKTEIVEIIDELVKSSPAISEANRLIFKPLLNSYSRDVNTAGPTEVNR